MNQSLRGHRLIFGVAALVFLVDRISKGLVLRHLAMYQAWNPVPGLDRLFTFTHVANSGIAFNLLPGRSALFAMVAVAVGAAIVLYYPHLPPGRLLVRLGLSLQLGGILGNLFDRLRYGAVIDFIDFRFCPVFNVADACIVAGVIILAFYFLREQEAVRPEPSNALPSRLSDAPAQPLDTGPADLN